MTEQTTNRRAEDKNTQVLATRIEGLAQDITEMLGLQDAWRFDPCVLREVVRHL